MFEVRVYRPDQSGAEVLHQVISREKMIADRDAIEYGQVMIQQFKKRAQLHTSTCKHCKKTFQSTNKGQKFCTTKIMLRNESCTYLFTKDKNKKPLKQKVCICCSKPFSTRLGPQMFCGDPCTYHSMPVKRQKCVCGGEFRTHRSDIHSCASCRGVDKKYESFKDGGASNAVIAYE